MKRLNAQLLRQWNCHCNSGKCATPDLNWIPLIICKLTTTVASFLNRHSVLLNLQPAIHWSFSSPMEIPDWRTVFVLSALLRVILIVYGEWQDKHMEVRYTDVDYFVFSDAAALMTSGKSPYQRTTYRYSPLLAFLLMPNSIHHRSWGKFLFSASGVWSFTEFVVYFGITWTLLAGFCMYFPPFVFFIFYLNSVVHCLYW